MRIDELAFDRASVRSYDTDGHLHVETANISKATINPYYGREIPDWQGLGLDADKLYQLFRPADELEKAAPTFAGKPIVLGHVALDAYDHPFERVVGAVGDDVRFDAPFLKAPLSIWPGEAIEGINNGALRALSCAYKYTPDMTPGTYEGRAYDGVMRNIVGNHLAIVREGRAGPDVIIGDSQPKEVVSPPATEINMTAIVLSRKATLAHGAVLGFVRPLLASDALPDLTGAFAGITSANYSSSKPAIAGKLAEKLNGKLAADKSLDDLPKFLAALDAMEPAEEEEKDDKKAEDEEEEDDKDKKKDDDKKAEDGVSKAAMDAALKSQKEAFDAALKAERASAKATAEAKEIVEKSFGKMKAFDSAPEYYRAGLKAMDVKGVDDLADSTLRPMFESLVDARNTIGKAPALKAMDSAENKSFVERFPNANRLKK